MTPQEQLRQFRARQNKEKSPQELLQEFRSSQSGSSLGMRKPKSFDELVAATSGKDEGFDYTTGAGGGLRAKLSFMETPEEILIR